MDFSVGLLSAMSHEQGVNIVFKEINTNSIVCIKIKCESRWISRFCRAWGLTQLRGPLLKKEIKMKN